jgi:2-methylcitrate dehydratase PrpD
MTSPAHRLIEYLASLSEKDLSPALVGSAGTALLDCIGCGLFGARQPWGEIARTFVERERSRGGATLFGSASPLSASRAALSNGTSTHGFELDDMLPGALVHPGAVVASAALAVAEDTGASGARLLLGLIAGYEMMGRLGLALGSAHNNRGFHTTGIAGPVAAAIACGVVLRFDVPRLHNAIGIACSSSAGIKAFAQGSGGMVKRMHAGRAAEAGVTACELAQLGFTGPLDAIAGRYGLLEVVGGDDVRPECLDEALGERMHIANVWVKVYSCCGVIHSTVHALESLKVSERFTADDVQSIEVSASRRAIEQNGEREPHDSMSAQYSIPFCAGVAVARDARDAAAFAQRNLDDPAVRSVAARTTVTFDADMDACFPAKFGARVRVALKDGRRAEMSVIDPHGSLADPCTAEDVERKFRTLTKDVMPEASAEGAIKAVRALNGSPDVGALSMALRAVSQTGGAA